jgi:hypothetical protein
MDGCVGEEMTSTKTMIFFMDEDGASGWHLWTIIHEEEPRQPCERVLRKALEVNKCKSQSRPRQFEKA